MIPFFGVLAQILYTVCQLPQIYKVYKTKNTSGISRLYLLIAMAAYLTNLVYVISLGDLILIIGTAFGLICITAVYIGTLLYRN